MSLSQLAEAMNCTSGVEVSVVLAKDEISTETLIRVMKEEMRKGNFIISNVLRSALDQEGYGHYSPIGAFHTRISAKTGKVYKNLIEDI